LSGSVYGERRAILLITTPSHGRRVATIHFTQQHMVMQDIAMARCKQLWKDL
jgi:hypothetical protein